MELSPSEIIRRADSLYALRSNIENVRLSVDLLHDIAGDRFDAAWRLGRSHFFLGQEAKGDDEAMAHYAQGITACTRAVKMQPERVEGQFWLGVNLALSAQRGNQFLALLHVFRAKKALRCAVRIDASYHGAGPLRVLGRLQHKLPRLFGGGVVRARANFERALQLAPENTVTRIYFAELLLEVEEEGEARKQLEAILSTPTNPVWEFETKRDQELAREKLARMSKMRKGDDCSG